MTTHKDLPPSSRKWAEEVDADRDRINELEAIVRRMASNLAVDYSNPQAGISAGSVPSVQNPMMLKLPSLQDLDIRDAQDGDLLTFDGKRGVWVARAHVAVMLPKTFPAGDPASYYVPTPSLTLADTWSPLPTYSNTVINPSFETGTHDWARVPYTGIEDPASVSLALSTVAGGVSGSEALQIDFNGTYTMSGPSDFRNWSVGIPVPVDTAYMSMQIKIAEHSGWRWGILYNTPSGYVVSETTGSIYAPLDTWFKVVQTQYGGAPAGATAAWVFIGGYSIPDTPRTLLIDSVLANSGAYPPGYFDGSTTSADAACAWLGAAHASASTATQIRKIKVPATFPVGVPIQVMGAGFVPGEAVSIGDYWGNTASATADSSGNFTVSMPIDPATWVGASSITATGSFTWFPSINVTITA